MVDINALARRILKSHPQNPLDSLLGISDANLPPVARSSFELSLEGLISCIDGLYTLGEDAVTHMNTFRHHLDAIQDITYREDDVALVGKKVPSLRSSNANLDRPYGTPTPTYLGGLAPYIQTEMERVSVKMGDTKEKRKQAQTSVSEEARVAE